MIHHNSENANVHMALKYLFNTSVKHTKPVYDKSIKISIRFDRIYIIISAHIHFSYNQNLTALPN